MIKAYLIIFLSLALFLFNCGGEKSPVNQKHGSKNKDDITIYVVRHAQAYKNINPLPDLPPEKLDSLTPEGEKQAESLGNYLKDKSIKMLYSSPTGRTEQTAEIIKSALQLTNQVILDKSFASLKKGQTPEGETVTWSWRVAQWKNGEDPRPKDGESLADGQKRAIDKLEQIAQNGSVTSIIIVTHGDICSAILAFANGNTITSAHEENGVDTGSVSEIIISDGKWKTLTTNLMK